MEKKILDKMEKYLQNIDKNIYHLQQMNLVESTKQNIHSISKNIEKIKAIVLYHKILSEE